MAHLRKVEKPLPTNPALKPKRKRNTHINWRWFSENFIITCPYLKLFKHSYCTMILLNSVSTRDENSWKVANSVNHDEVAHNEPPHLDLHCLPSNFEFSMWYSLDSTFFENLRTEILSYAELNSLTCHQDFPMLSVNKVLVVKLLQKLAQKNVSASRRIVHALSWHVQYSADIRLYWGQYVCRGISSSGRALANR